MKTVVGQFSGDAGYINSV